MMQLRSYGIRRIIMHSSWSRRLRRGIRHQQITLFLCGAYFLFAAVLPAQTATKDSSLDPLHQMSNTIEALVRRVSPSVVQILVTGYGPLDEGDHNDTGLVIGKQHAIGSGVIIDPEGYIVTNAHVLTGAQRVRVVVPAPSVDTTPIRSLNIRGNNVEARIIGVSDEIDLAILKIEGSNLPALPLARFGRLRQGELAFAFGSPEGLRNSVTMGVVSAAARQPDPDNPKIYIQTDAPINPGNSGGPLVNVDGEVIGINTFILTKSGGNEGLGFAIPSSVVAYAYPQLRKYGHVHRLEIGVSVQTITPTLAAGLGLPRDFGVIVSDVQPDGPAAKAGLKIQDVVVGVNGRAMDSVPMFGYSFFTQPPGESVKLDVLRGSDKLTLEVPVTEQPHEVDRLVDFANPEKNLVQKLGVLGVEIDKRVAALTPNLRDSTGVLVTAKAAGAGSPENSLTTGDVIHALNGVRVTSLEGLRSALDQIKPDGPVVLQIEREGKMMYLSLQMEGT
jgi:serine protease Do